MKPEAAPPLDYVSHREAESRARPSDANEREALKETLREQAIGEPVTAQLVDTRFDVADFRGSVRIRQVTVGSAEPYYLWTVKVYMDEDTTKVIKAPLEHEGRTETREEAEDAIKQFFNEVFGREIDDVPLSVTVHERTSYQLQNGVTANVDTFTSKNGVEHEPQESVEFEVPLPENAGPQELAQAEQTIIETAESVGITADRLSPRSGIINTSVPAPVAAVA